MPGALHVGTSGFSYADWAPLFYRAGARGDGLLRHYAERLNACELNNTFYRHPRPDGIARWLAQVPDTFRFTVKAQRGGSMRALMADPAATVAWLSEPYRLFGERLGSVLFRVPDVTQRDDERLRGLLDAWPRDLPLTLEFQHVSWVDDAVLEMARGAGAAWCATDVDELPEPPRLHVTAPFLYLRLRRETYDDVALDAWADRLVPFLDDGRDAFVFFRHDEHGESALRAESLRERVVARLR